MFIGEIFEAATPKRPGIEAHGIRGFKNTPWRKIFKSTEAMLAWAEKYDAEILGTRDLESASQGRLAPAISEDSSELSVGDPVIITGDVQFNGATGEIDSFGQNNAFVVVNLYNHGRHSFHSSDVSFNDYADSDEEEARMHDDGEFRDDFEESATLYDETETNESAGLDRDPSPEAIARNKRLGDIWRKTAGMTAAEYAATIQTDGRAAAALRAQADADEPGNIASQARAAEYKKKFQRVGEAKSLSKQVRVVKGPYAGSTGWIREIKTGAFKGAPKTYFVDLDNGKQANNLPASALRLIKAPVTEFKDALALKPGLLVNHPLTGNCRIVSISGDQVKVSTIKGGKVYTVQRSSLKLGPMKMEEQGAGISKDAETKFHSKLDKLVHSTFGKRKDEMAEDGEGTPEGLPSITPTMAQNILNQIETEGPSAISKSIEWGDGAAAEMIAMFKADLKKVAAGEKVIDEACWKNYRQIGMKKKNGKQVPNCVPESNYAGRKDVPGFMSGQ